MHNRARMIVASFLTKDLRIHWMHGEKHFFDRLIDADIASKTVDGNGRRGQGPTHRRGSGSSTRHPRPGGSTPMERLSGGTCRSSLAFRLTAYTSPGR